MMIITWNMEENKTGGCTNIHKCYLLTLILNLAKCRDHFVRFLLYVKVPFFLIVLINMSINLKTERSSFKGLRVLVLSKSSIFKKRRASQYKSAFSIVRKIIPLGCMLKKESLFHPAQ